MGLTGPNFKELLKHQKSSLAQQNDAYQNTVTSQNTIAHVQSATGILLVFA